MKWMIASDVHGSAYWCGKMIEAYRREGADRLLLLGDVLYHGPRNDLPEEYRPREVIGMLNGMAEDILAVRGNCEAEVDQTVLSFPVTADYAVITAGSRMIFATHGHLWNGENVPPLHRGDVLLHGHTHVPACEDRGNYVYINPGSVSIPKEGSPRGYMTFDEEVFLWKTLDGEVYNEYRI